MATLLRPMLAARYACVRLADVRDVASPASREEVVVCDLDDRAALARALDGSDAVLHLGAVSKEASFGRIAPANIVGVANLLALCVEQGVRRVVLASSMHVLGMYGRGERVGPGTAPRPDGLYAVSKLFAEQLGYVYATKYGLEVACLRIGHVTRRCEDAEPGNWIAPEDLGTLAIAMLEHPAVRFEVVPAVAEHAGDPLGQDEVARRFGVVFSHQGPPYAKALAGMPAWLTEDPVARARRGGVFASAMRPMV